MSSRPSIPDQRRITPYLAFYFYFLGRPRLWFRQTDGRLMKGPRIASRPNRNGYRRFAFRLFGHRYEVMEHLAHWFFHHRTLPLASKTDRIQLNHKDLNRSNNSLSNLEPVTQSENIRHRMTQVASRLGSSLSRPSTKIQPPDRKKKKGPKTK